HRRSRALTVGGGHDLAGRQQVVEDVHRARRHRVVGARRFLRRATVALRAVGPGRALLAAHQTLRDGLVVVGIHVGPRALGAAVPDHRGGRAAGRDAAIERVAGVGRAQRAERRHEAFVDTRAGRQRERREPEGRDAGTEAGHYRFHPAGSAGACRSGKTQSLGWLPVVTWLSMPTVAPPGWKLLSRGPITMFANWAVTPSGPRLSITTLSSVIGPAGSVSLNPSSV